MTTYSKLILVFRIRKGMPGKDSLETPITVFKRERKKKGGKKQKEKNVHRNRVPSLLLGKKFMVPFDSILQITVKKIHIFSVLSDTVKQVYDYYPTTITNPDKYTLDTDHRKFASYYSRLLSSRRNVLQRSERHVHTNVTIFDDPITYICDLEDNSKRAK